MSLDNTTQTAMETLATHGISDQFLYRVSGYSEPLIRDAREGNTVFLGHALWRMQRLAEVCEKMSSDPDVRLSPSDYLERSILTFTVEDEELDGLVGMLVANGQISSETAVEAARGLRSIPNPPPFYREPVKEYHWPKTGIRQVW